MYTKNNNNAFTCHMDKYGLSWGKVEGFAGWEFIGTKFGRETFTGWEFTSWELERVGILQVGIDRRDSLGGGIFSIPNKKNVPEIQDKHFISRFYFSLPKNSFRLLSKTLIKKVEQKLVQNKLISKIK